MRYLTYLLLSLVSLAASAQSAPPINGSLQKWGELRQGETILGHYGVVVRTEEKQKFGIYTVMLYDSDLQPVGEKTYPAGADNVVHDVAYNGTHLGVLLYDKQGTQGRIEVLDARAETVSTHKLRSQMKGSTGDLVETLDGFVAISSFPLQPENVSMVNRNFLVEKVVTEGEGGPGWIRRFGSPDNRGTDVRLAINGLDDEVMMVSVWEVRGSNFRGKLSSAICAIGLDDGRDHFSEMLELQRADEAPTFIGAARVGDGYRLLRMTNDRTEKKVVVPGILEVLTFDGEGQLQSVRPINLHAAIVARLRLMDLPQPRVATSYRYNIGVITPEGGFSLVVEPYVPVGFARAFPAGYALAFTKEGTLSDLTTFEQHELILPQVFNDPRMYNLLQMHGIPFDHALSTRRGDLNFHYVLDRKFDKGEITYYGINAAVLDGGTFVNEYIPLKGADYINVHPARAGYLCVLQVNFAERQIVPRLEKLNY